MSLESYYMAQCKPCTVIYSPDNKIHGVNMGPIWGRQDPGGPHVGPMNFEIWVIKLLLFPVVFS